MTREEAAKDPKRNPKKRRANYTQKKPELIQGNHAQKRQSIRTHNGKTRSGTAASIRHNARNAHRTTKGATDEETHAKQNKSPQRATDEARTGHGSTAGKHPRRKRCQRSTQEPRKASERNAERLPEGAKGPQMKPRTTEAAPGLPKRRRKTTTDHRQCNRSPTERRNERKPIKYTSAAKNATTAQILNQPTKDGQKPEKGTEKAQKKDFYSEG